MSTLDKFLSVFENENLIPKELQESIKKIITLVNQNDCLVVVRASTIRMVKFNYDYIALKKPLQSEKYYFDGAYKDFEYSFCIRKISTKALHNDDYELVLIIFIK